MREAGIQVPHSCEEGVCGACETRVISGIPDHRDSILTESERKENATMMICCSGSKSPKPGARHLMDQTNDTRKGWMPCAGCAGWMRARCRMRSTA